ncbi:RF-1 domain-containing protein [Syncephalis plumigaleata]|nr:RF-1 domain-containing protein [Syncephalis plumigaleata]
MTQYSVMNLRVLSLLIARQHASIRSSISSCLYTRRILANRLAMTTVHHYSTYKEAENPSVVTSTALAESTDNSTSSPADDTDSIGTTSLLSKQPWQAASNKSPPTKPIEIVIDENDLEEKFVRGSGPGGQKINKTSSCVDLLHVPTGIRIKCQATRSRDQNRKIARKLLKDRLDQLFNGELSRTAQKIMKAKRAQARRKKRAAKKYHSSDIATSDDTIETTPVSEDNNTNA